MPLCNNHLFNFRQQFAYDGGFLGFQAGVIRFVASFEELRYLLLTSPSCRSSFARASDVRVFLFYLATSASAEPTTL
jgi:hypothetical protein